MKLATILIITFLGVALVIGITSLTGTLLINNNIIEIVERENPKLQALVEMEINVKEASKDVLDFLKLELPAGKEGFSANIADFAKFEKQYGELATTDKEKELADRLHEEIAGFTNVGWQLIASQEEQRKNFEDMQVLVVERFDVVGGELEANLVPSDPDFTKKERSLLEMQTNLHQVVLISQGYQLKPTQFPKEQIIEGINDFEFWKGRFLGMQLTNEEKALASEIQTVFLSVKGLTQEMIELEDAKQELLEEFEAGGAGIITLLDGELQTTAMEKIKKDEVRARDITGVVLSAVGVVVPSAAAVGILISRSISKPLVKLRDASGEIAKGNLDVKIDPHGSSEIVTLADAFNSMAEQLKFNKEALEKNNDELTRKNQQLVDLAIQLERQAEKLREADRQRDEFSSMITHELKTPLVPVQGYCELLLDGTYGELTEKQREKIQKIYANSTRLLNLIQDVLDVHKLELGQMKFEMTDTSAKYMIKECVDAFLPAVQSKGINLMNMTNGDDLNFRCDPKRVFQVLSNLVSNAMKFVPDNNGRIEISARRENGHVLFSVRDNGIGVPKEKQHDLFKKFYQVDTSLSRNHSGTGLGLTISKGIVEAHGGRIWLDSDEGKGTTFYFSLPAGGKQ